MGRIFLLAFLTACAPPLPPAEQRADHAIIGGTADSGDPAVVLLISYPQNQSTFYTCTASFISPTVLVTAAHCVDDANHTNYTFGIFLGSDALAYSTVATLAPELVPVSEVHANPAYNPLTPFTADIGVVLLSAPQAITPLPLQKVTLGAGIVGQTARLVGYGQTVYQTFNDSKYTVTTTVASLGGDDTVAVGDAGKHSCVGDSGGPALVMMSGVETIIGVDSYTDVAGCTAPAHYRRVDEYVGFLDSYLMMPLDMAAPNDLSPAPNDLTSEPNDAAAIKNDDLAVAPADLAAHPKDAGPNEGDQGVAPPKPSGGCSYSGGPTSGALPLALLLLGFLWRAAVPCGRRCQ